VRARDQSHSDALKEAGAAAVVPEMLEASLQLAGQTLRAAGVPIEVVETSLETLRAEDYVPVEDIIAPTEPDSGD
jgi:CPA2 family monovalent cation:H+ antiporter-2